MADNLIPRNVATNIKLPKMRKKEIHPLTPDQAKAFLEAARRDRYEALYVLAIHYGLRRGELLGLKWSDLQGNTLQVRRTMSEARVGRIEEEPRTARDGAIELSEKALDALRSHRRQQVGVTDSEYIFPLRRAHQRTPVTSCTAASNRLSSVPGYPKSGSMILGIHVLPFGS